MLKTSRVFSLMVLWVVLGSALASAQGPTEQGIRNWPAPLFWNPPEGLTASQGKTFLEGKSSVALRPEEAQTATAPLPFISISPCRMLDTRITGGAIASGTTRDATLTGAPCGIPSTAAAVSANFAVFNILGASGNGVLKVWPAGSPSTFQALLNWSPAAGQLDNASVVPLGSGGAITVQPNQGGGSIDLVIDVNGYYGGSVVTDITAGTGLSGGGTGSVTLNLNFGGTGSATTASRSDHTHSTADITSGFLADARLGGTYSNSLTFSNNSNSFTAGSVQAASLSAGGLTLTGNLSLPPTSGSAAGVVNLGGSRFLHAYGTNNTFLGSQAGNFSMTSIVGSNSAFGASTLASNSTGNKNTAIGAAVLYSNTTGTDNTAVGTSALFFNDLGIANTAIGSNALSSNTTGSNNTAVGLNALSNATGSNNIAVAGGYNLTTGSNNIDIGNIGVGAESNTIRIGTVGTQTATFIAGISDATSASGSAVFVNSSGQLGTATSSRRFKRDVRDVGEESSGLFQLRPVMFRYTAELDPTGLKQYGLIAEEVAEIYPDLVIYDRDAQPQTVRYHFLVPMLLNEVQRQRRTIEDQQATIVALRQMIEEQKAQTKDLTARLFKLEEYVGSQRVSVSTEAELTPSVRQ